MNTVELPSFETLIEKTRDMWVDHAEEVSTHLAMHLKMFRDLAASAPVGAHVKASLLDSLDQTRIALEQLSLTLRGELPTHHLEMRAMPRIHAFAPADDDHDGSTPD